MKRGRVPVERAGNPPGFRNTPGVMNRNTGTLSRPLGSRTAEPRRVPESHGPATRDALSLRARFAQISAENPEPQNIGVLRALASVRLQPRCLSCRSETGRCNKCGKTPPRFRTTRSRLAQANIHFLDSAALSAASRFENVLRADSAFLQKLGHDGVARARGQGLCTHDK